MLSLGVRFWLAGLLLASAMAGASLAAASSKPNIVVLLVDDGGYMDFGSYGGEASTPAIDELAAAGVRFTNYHTSPICAPSRAMLLTGLDSHRTGVATIGELLTEEQRDQPDYAPYLRQGVATLASRLKGAGYKTYMTGKWHLGSGPGQLPSQKGFDRTFILDASGADNWEQKSYSPYYDHAPWFADGEPADLPEDFYSSEFLVDQMISYLEADDSDAPFFAYVAFQAIHIPIQAPPEYTRRYEGVYADGWEATMARRFNKAKELGLISSQARPPQLHSSLRSWASLTAEQQRYYEKSMMVNAGMIEAMDHHIGRLLSYLKAAGKFDNTLFVVTSDNGPEYNDPSLNIPFRFWTTLNGYHFDIERLGERGSMAAIGPEWGSAAAVPGSLFKFYASEGGTRVPFIVSGPGVERQGLAHAFTYVTDLTPTLMSLVGLAPDPSLDGKNMLPLLSGKEDDIYKSDYRAMEVSSNAFLVKGEHKLVRITPPFGDGQWRLYNIVSDPAETQDLSAQLPALKQELLGLYADYQKQVGVRPLPAGFIPAEQLGANLQAKLVEYNGGYLVAAAFLLLAIVLALVVAMAALARKLAAKMTTHRME